MKTSAKTRFAIVDDHPMIRRGVATTINEVADFEVVAEGGSGSEAIAIAEKLLPDAMLLDVSMPDGGIEAAEVICARWPDIKIVMLTIRDDLEVVRRALKAGAAGFVSKGVDGQELVACVQRIIRGERYVSPELGAKLLQIEPLRDEKVSRSTPLPHAGLSKRDYELLELLGEGLSNGEIAVRADLAETTVKQYVSTLIQKLGVRNRTEAALLIRTGRIAPRQSS